MMPSSNRVVFGCTMLAPGKAGVVKRDEHGYFLGVPLGAYGAYNSMEFLYDAQSGVAMFAEGSPLRRQLAKGVLYGEYKHPEQHGMSDIDYMRRIRTVDMDRVSHHIRSVELVASRDERGRPITLVLGDIRPWGPFGQYVEDALSNAAQNSFFSVRSITMDDRLRQIKYTREIISWDFVGEGGILQANKYNAPALESFTDKEFEITPTLLWQLVDEQKKNKGMGLESSSLDFEHLARELGWARQTHVTPNRPKFMGW